MSSKLRHFLAHGLEIKPPYALRLGGESIGDEGLIALSRSPSLQRVRHLYLSTNGLTPKGAKALADSSFTTSLQSIKLAGNFLGDEGVEALALSPNLGALRELSLADNGISPQGVRALSHSPVVSGLQKLSLSTNFRLGDEGALALAGSTGLASLQDLRLACTFVSDKGARALVSSPYLRSLQSLDMTTNHCDPGQRLDDWRKRKAIQSEPETFWKDGSDPVWRLFAYSRLLPEVQKAEHPTFLDFASTFLASPEGLAWSWCQRHILGWSGPSLQAACERFPAWDTLQERRAQESRRRSALEEALF